jgi:hypothetical protein
MDNEIAAVFLTLVFLVFNLGIEVPGKKPTVIPRLLINTLSGCLLTVCALFGSDNFLLLFFVPGLFFGLSVSLSLKQEPVITRWMFAFSSLIVYTILAGFMAMPGSILIAASAGALIMTFQFCFLFHCGRFFGRTELLTLILMIIAFALSLELDRKGVSFLFIWQLGVAFVFARMYYRKEKALNSSGHIF